jgi:hypothetical protein
MDRRAQPDALHDTGEREPHSNGFMFHSEDR